MAEKIGLVAFSFALRDVDREPNPCNIRLAKAVERIIQSEYREVVAITQWEITRQLKRDGCMVAHSVELRKDGKYLDSEGVWEEAKEIFRRMGITEVIPVAQPFLQMIKIKAMIQADGFEVIDREIGRIGFDKESNQPWTRGPIQLFVYALRQKLTGSRGK